MNKLLTNKRILITAGPTREAIDPIRYVSKQSTGKMGYAIAEAFLKEGAEVVLVSGPVNMFLEHPNLTLVKVNTAMEMDFACCRFYEKTDIAIFTAAVTDYRPESISDHKIKKDSSSFTIRMVKNVDIAFEFGKVKSPKQLSIGFAMEAITETSQAVGKLNKKNFDMVILNSMNDESEGYNHDINKMSIIRKDHSQTDYALKDTATLSSDILKEITELMLQHNRLNDGEFIGMTG